MGDKKLSVRLVPIIETPSLNENDLYIRGNFGAVEDDDIKDLLQSKEGGHLLAEHVKKLTDSEALVTLKNNEG